MIDGIGVEQSESEHGDLDITDESGYVILRLKNGHIQTKNFNSENISGGNNEEISVLWIGNSLTQDAVSYLPFVLTNLAPGIRFNFYMWYDGGAQLADILTHWNNAEKAEIFSVCENTTSWTNYPKNNGGKTITDILGEYRFDVVCIEEYFNYNIRRNGYEGYQDDFNDVVEFIRDNYAYPFKVVSFFHAPLRKTLPIDPVDSSLTAVQMAEKVFGITKDGVEWQMQNTIAESIIPAGIAVYRAMSVPELDALGDTQHLSPDGTHTQEGLPCLMQAWVVALWIFDHLGIQVSINNTDKFITSANYAAINVPGANIGSGVVAGTTEQNRLAMDVAIKAHKEGKYIELNALTNNA